MTEIPEHLLQRSRERRAALGGDGGGGGDAPAAETPAASSGSGSGSGGSGAESGGGGAAAPVPSSAGAPAAVPPDVQGSPPAVVEEELAPVFVADQAVRRTRIPVFAVPLLALLPFWAFLYAGAFGERGGHEVVDPAVLGPQVYATNCAACHGAAGEGGSGPALGGGEAALTFPDEQDHVEWVRVGSQGRQGQPYGDPNRPGGQRIAQTGQMPPFAGTLSPEEIAAVVQFEREGL